MMRNIFTVVIATLTVIAGIATPASAGMGSSSFQIPTSVISSGGIPMTSASFQANATLGQPSPVNGIISSPSFIVDSGFWSTIISENRTKAMPWMLLLLPSD